MQTATPRVRARTAARFVLTLILGSTLSPTAFGQEGEAQKEKTITEQIQELVQDLETREGDLAELRDKIAEREGTAAAHLLETELVEQRSRYRRGMIELVDLVVDAEDAGADVARARSAATRMLEESAVTIRKDTRDSGVEILELIERAASASPEEAKKARTALKTALPNQNRLLKELDANIDAREKLHLDVEADIRSLTKILETRSKAISGGLQQAKELIEDIEKRPGAAEDAEAQKELAALREARDLLAETQTVNVDLMDERGLETAELRQGIISATGTISDDILDKKVATGLIEEWIADGGEWLKTNGSALFFRAVIFLLILLGFWFVSRISRGIVRRALDRSKLAMSSLAKAFFIKMTGRLIMLLGILIAIAQLGIEIGPLLAGLGIAGFVVGFALQDTLSNFASGLMILVYRPFDVGDVVEAGGVMGKVDQMNLVSTMVLTFDNQLLVVPNTQIWGGVIRNVTHQDKRRVDLTFGIGYSDDIPKAESVLSEIVTGHEKVLKDPEPVVRLHELGDSSVNFVVRPWAKTDDYWDVYWDITREVKRRFDEEGISIPFPQRDIHLYREDSGDAATGGGETQRSETRSSAQTVMPGEDGGDADD